MHWRFYKKSLERGDWGKRSREGGPQNEEVVVEEAATGETERYSTVKTEEFFSTNIVSSSRDVFRLSVGHSLVRHSRRPRSPHPLAKAAFGPVISARNRAFLQPVDLCIYVGCPDRESPDE